MIEENISPETILQSLNTRFIGQKIIYFSTLESTMEAAKREALWGAEAGTVVIADRQTAARGRLQRTWISPKGSLAMSVILRPNLNYLPSMVMLASLAVVNSIQIITGLKPQIKWPNDVLINDKKVCGILIENDIRKNTLKHTIVGMGINVNLRIANYPEIAPLATSLSDQLGKKVSRLDLTRQILIEMDNFYQTITQNDSILEQWKTRLVTLGRNIQVRSGFKINRGIAESVAKDGSLMLRQRDGSLIKIVAGDVTLK
jgi:BirA family transcriptional regulator, biotin operon repressor / biotin---[acetyl-CoA-carboxylase] ligase